MPRATAGRVQNPSTANLEYITVRPTPPPPPSRLTTPFPPVAPAFTPGVTRNCQVRFLNGPQCGSEHNRIALTNWAKREIRARFCRAIYMSKLSRDVGGPAGVRHLVSLGWVLHGVSTSVNGRVKVYHLSFIPSSLRQ